MIRIILIVCLSTSFSTRQVVARNFDSTQAEAFRTIHHYAGASPHAMDANFNVATRHLTAVDATLLVTGLPTRTGVSPIGGVWRDPRTVRLAQASTMEANATATSPDTDSTMLGISELLVGVVDHDTGVISDDTEGGAAFTAELRFKPLGGPVFEFLRSPRPHLGFNLNTSGNTSSLYAGLTWQWPFGNRYFVSFAFGGAVHDGTLKTNNREKRKNNKQLGCRFLFREAVELGVTFLKQHALSIRFDHLSNANLCDNNEGLDTVGLVYGYRF